MLTGIIMASGLSRRMNGHNKLLMKIDGKYIFEHSMDSIIRSDVDKIIVVTWYDEIIDFCKKNDVLFVQNNFPEAGQSESIKLGIKNCDAESDFMFFVADQPFLKTDTINFLIKKYHQNKQKIIIPKNKNTLGNPRIFPKSMREEFLSLTGDVRGFWIIKKHPELVKYINIQDDVSFRDIDTLEDYKNLV